MSTNRSTSRKGQSQVVPDTPLTQSPVESYKEDSDGQLSMPSAVMSQFLQAAEQVEVDRPQPHALAERDVAPPPPQEAQEDLKPDDITLRALRECTEDKMAMLDIRTLRWDRQRQWGRSALERGQGGGLPRAAQGQSPETTIQDPGPEHWSWCVFFVPRRIGVKSLFCPQTTNTRWSAGSK